MTQMRRLPLLLGMATLGVAVVTGMYIRSDDNIAVVVGDLEKYITALDTCDDCSMAAGDLSGNLYLIGPHGEKRATLRMALRSSVQEVLFSPDQSHVAICGLDNQVVVVNVATTKVARRYVTEATWLYGLSFSTDGTRLVAGGMVESSDSGLIVEWDWNGGMDASRVVKLERPVRVVAHLTSDVVIAKCSEGPLCEIDLKAGSITREYAVSHLGPNVLHAAPDKTRIVGSDIVIGDIPTALAIIDRASGRVEKLIERPVHAISVSPDDKLVAVLSYPDKQRSNNGRIELFELYALRSSAVFWRFQRPCSRRRSHRYKGVYSSD
jgi:WD40 repeat protein